MISFRYESPLKIESAVVLASLKGKHFSFLSNIVNNGEEFFVSGEYTSFDHDVNMNKEETQDENQNEIKYFWQQTSDQVTISIPLPSTIQKSEIKCSFTNNSIMVTEKNNILEGKLHSRLTIIFYFIFFLKKINSFFEMLESSQWKVFGQLNK